LTYADTAVAISTPAERSLWRKLYFLNTDKHTHWKRMLHAWNHVAEQQKQLPVPTVTAKTERHLREHEAEEIRALKAASTLTGFTTSVYLEVQNEGQVTGMGHPLTNAEAQQ
jgi:hypothetical protein